MNHIYKGVHVGCAYDDYTDTYMLYISIYFVVYVCVNTFL